MDSKTLSVGQLGWTILLSRLFVLLTFSNHNSSSSGSVALLAVPIGAAITLLFVHLISLTLKWLNYDGTTDALDNCPKIVSVTFFGIMWLYAVVAISLTGAEFNGFLETTVFAQESIFLYTILFLLCCGYSAIGGRGSIGGIALLSGAFLVVSVATITVAVAPDINLFEVVSPFSEGTNTLIKI